MQKARYVVDGPDDWTGMRDCGTIFRRYLYVTSGATVSSVKEDEVLEALNHGKPDQILYSEISASDYLKRVLQCETLKGSPNLRRLLEYIGTRSLYGTGNGLKEYTIGVEALDRNEDFDPKIDTIVRVQIHRLREKLSRFYLGEGSQDKILITIPRGHYYVEFISAKSPSASSSALSEFNGQVDSAIDAGDPDSSVNRGRYRLWPRPLFFGLVIALLILAIITSGLYIRQRSVLNRNIAPNDIDPSVATLWSSFLEGDKEPIIGYTDAVFLIDESNDLLRFPSGASSHRGSSVESHLAEEFASNPDLVKRAGPLYYEDGYTGTGEVESAANLAALFRELGAHAQIKRGSDITIEDLRNHNVVLLGSSFQNKAVDDLPRQGDFRFVKAAPRHELWDGAISNLNPSPGESSIYRTERDPVTHTLRADHALVSFQPGLTPDRHIVILAGLDTTGTAGATRYATSHEGASLILKIGDSHKKSNQKIEPVLQIVVRCLLKDGDSTFEVKPVASHANEWREKDN